MKKLRIRKIITALIVITWVPSSFASPSGISARSSSAASRRSSIATPPSVEAPSGIFARSSSVASPSSIATPSGVFVKLSSVVTPSSIETSPPGETSISILGIDGKNEINLNVITSSNGQKLVTFEYCQDASCRPLGLEEGYSLEILEKSLEPWEKLINEYEKIYNKEQMIRSFHGGDVWLAALFGASAARLLLTFSAMLLMPVTVVAAGVVVGGLSYLGFLSLRNANRMEAAVMSRAERILEIIDRGWSLEIVVEDNIIRKIVTEIEKASEEGSKTLVPHHRY